MERRHFLIGTGSLIADLAGPALAQDRPVANAVNFESIEQLWSLGGIEALNTKPMFDH